mmetsp:Transcript_7038/g.23058  ORF Transcript_7038/g.23058 Transcript_7038/m.23058 type:complete len:247 (-) Transcript_7038:1599-2339(-)
MPPLGRALVLAPSEDRSIDLTNYVASDGSVSSPSTRRHACGAGVGWSSFLSPFFFSFVRSFLFKVVVETLRMLERLVWNLRRSFASTTVEIFFFSVRARTRHRCFGPSSSASSSSSSSTSIFLSLAAVTRFCVMDTEPLSLVASKRRVSSERKRSESRRTIAVFPFLFFLKQAGTRERDDRTRHRPPGVHEDVGAACASEGFAAVSVVDDGGGGRDDAARGRCVAGGGAADDDERFVGGADGGGGG